MNIPVLAAQPELSLNMLLIGQDSTFPLYKNPTTDESEVLVEKFAQDNQVMYWGFQAIKAMTGYLYPQANLERVTILGQFMHVDFYVDDLYGDLPTSQGLIDVPPAVEVMNLIDGCIRAFTTGQLSVDDHQAAQAFLNISRSIMPLSDPVWFKRLAKNIADHLNYTVNPTAYGWRSDGSIPISEYILMREIISGMYPTIDFIEFATNVYLPVEVINHPQIVKLRQGCNRICCLTNDLFSYEKESMVKGLPLNLIRVIELNENLPLTEAVHKAIGIINDEIIHFKKTAENCQVWDSHTNAQVREYILGLNYQIGATWYWETSTNRYRSPQSPFIELRMLL